MTVHPKFRGETASLPVAGPGTRTSQARGLIALTNDPLLIRALQDLAEGGIDISVVSDLRSMTDELLQQTGATALIDAAALDAPVDGVVDVITRQLPDLRLMVAGHGAEQQQLPPASPTRPSSASCTSQLRHSACNCSSMLPRAPGAAATLRFTPAVAANQQLFARIGTAIRGGSPRLLALIGMAIIAAIAAAAWAFWPDGKSADKAPVRIADATRAPAHPEVAALITQADQAFAAARYVASDGSSAAELYRAALKADPSSQVAAKGYDGAIDQGLHSAEKSLLAGRLNEASTIAEAVRLIAPDNPRLEFLNAQISRELARVSSDDSQRQALEARQAQVRAAPVNSKAPGLDVLRRRVDEIIVQPVAPAPANPAPPIEIPAPAPATASSQATAPATVAAAEAVATAAAQSTQSRVVNEVVSARALKLLRSENPVYPDWALEQLISGWWNWNSRWQRTAR